MKNKIYGAIIGAAVGDALGAPLEFLEERPESLFIRDMVGGGILKHNPGDITDDTQMAMCIMDMYLKHNEYNQKTVIENYLKWLDTDPKDVGAWTYKVLNKYKDIGSWTDKFKVTDQLRGDNNPAVQLWKDRGMKDAGNGGVMKCMPTAVFRHNNEMKLVEETIFLCEETHPDPRCILSCLIVNKLIAYGIKNYSKQQAYNLILKEFKDTNLEIENAIIDAKDMPYDEWDNKGYTVSTLKCALAAWLQYDFFEEGLVMVVNRGNDADTVGCVAGALLGAFHGFDSIPERWLSKLGHLDYLKKFCDFCFYHQISESGKVYD